MRAFLAILLAILAPLAAPRWRSQSPPIPSSLASSLAGVSCASRSECVAVGNAEVSGSKFPAFAEVWNGRNWRISTVPFANSSVLSGVSCPAAGDCIAVGDISRSGVLQTLAERWPGGGWRIQRTPNPAGALQSFLLSVSCPATNSCTATGFWLSHSGQNHTLAEHWGGRTWRIQPTPNPSLNTQVELNGVSCNSARACMATGVSDTGIFAEQWNGRAWRITSVPLPRGGRNAVLGGVSCPSATACTAVGEFFAGSHLQPLADRWNGRRWNAQQAPAPTPPAGLLSVSCAGLSVCTATGFGAGGSALAEHWNGRRWFIQLVPVPPGSVQTDLDSVSCSGPAACTAVGFFTNASSAQFLVADRYS